MHKKLTFPISMFLATVLIISGCIATTSTIQPTSTHTLIPPTRTQSLPTATPQISQETKVSTEEPTGLTCPKIAFVLITETNADIYSACPDGTSLKRITTHQAIDGRPAWSPNGTQLAFASERMGKSQIFITDKDGNSITQLTSDLSNDFPIWIPDKEQIAFRTTDGQGRWWWRIWDFERQELIQLSPPTLDFYFQTPSWSPDGQQLAYMSLAEQEQRNDGSSQIHIKNVDGSNDIALTNDMWTNVNPVWSPDGTQIAFLSEPDGTINSFALYTIKKDGSSLKRLTPPIFTERARPSWAPDSQAIAIVGDALDSHNIFIVNTDTGVMREFLDLGENESAAMPSWQPNVSTASIPKLNIDIGTAEGTFRKYFDYLSAGKYDQAAQLYGGIYDELISYNSDLSPDDHKSLLQNACKINGFQCLRVKEILTAEKTTPDSVLISARFMTEDGEMFVRGPCCGASEEDMPPQSVFDFLVKITEHGEYKIMDLPVYVP